MKQPSTTLLLPSFSTFKNFISEQKENFKNSDAIFTTTLNEVRDQLEKQNIPFLDLEISLESNSKPSFFLSNWISFHESGDVVLYPSKTTRLNEMDLENVLQFIEDKGFLIENVIDYTSACQSNFFLEGTNSLVYDAKNACVYAAISEDTNEELAIEFCEDFDCAPVFFEATKVTQQTSSIVFIGAKFALFCADAIKDKKERKLVLESLKKSNKEVIFLIELQLNCFVTSSIEIFSTGGTSQIIMSTSAFKSLNELQLQQIKKFAKILVIDITSFEVATGVGLASFITPIRLPML